MTVVATVAAKSEEAAEQALQRATAPEAIDGLSSLAVLGTLGPGSSLTRETKKKTAGGRELWIRLDYSTGLQQDEPLPYVAEVLHRCKHRGEEHITTQVILYEPPASQSGHFLTTEPLPMDRDDEVLTPRVDEPPPPPASAAGEGDTGLDRHVQQINSAWLVGAMLIHTLAHPDAATPTSCAALSSMASRGYAHRGVWNALAALAAACDRWLFVPLLWLLDLSVPFGLTSLLRIKQATAVGRQLDLRLRSLRQCVAQWTYLSRDHHNPWQHTPKRRVVEVSLANAFWLMTIDALAGVLFVFVAWSSADWLAQEISASDYEDLWCEPLRGGVIFLMNQPGGVKLNPQLSDALGAVFLYLIDSWTVVTAGLLPYLPSLLRVASLAGLMGLTMTLALLSDMVSFFTIHVFYFYTVSARFYAIMLHILSSLWKLFRGKKRNVLRQRIDSYSYDVDQLLLGTLLFTVIFFLLPTTFVFYLYFGVLRLLVLCLYAALAFLTEGLNHFPLYSLFLSLSDPKSLPSGVSFSALAVPQDAARRASYLVLHSRTMALGALFYHYTRALRDVVRRYSPQTLLSRFLVGDIMIAT